MRVFLHNPGSGLLANLADVLVAIGDGRPVRRSVRSTRTAGRHLLLALEEVDDRDGAAQLNGARVLVPRERLPGLADGEYYVDDLIGLEVVEGDRLLGRVTSSREQGGVEVLAVAGDEQELEIPFVEQYVIAVDVDRGRVEVSQVDDLPRTPADGGGRSEDG